MELQACEMADQIHPFIKSFGNHNTTLSTTVSAELVKYNLWYKKYFKTEDKTSYVEPFRAPNINEMNHVPVPSLAFDKLQDYYLKGLCYSDDNPQMLSVVETALCYGLILDYDAITARKKEVDAIKFDGANIEKKEFLNQLRKLNIICRFKILDTAMFTLYETDVLTQDSLSLFSVNNTTDHITELLALDVFPSEDFEKKLHTVTDMARNNNASVFKIIEQYAFLPYTLENDLLKNASKSEREELEKKITEIREIYARNSQNVTDATVFRVAEDEEEAYDFQASMASSADKMNMYG